jgi:hypothetical protein
METTETTETTEISTAAPTTYEQCDECHSPVDADQRYCVVCGAHRRHVRDPAARYLSTASARGRRPAPAGGPVAPRGRRSNLGVALALVAIPIAIALGLLVGRSSTSGDAKLIAALRAQKPEVITTGGGAGGVASGTAATTTSSAGKHGKKAAAATSTGKTLSSTKYGSANQILGTKPTASDLAQGEAVAKHIQATQGKSYVNAQKNLPSQISIP